MTFSHSKCLLRPANIYEDFCNEFSITFLSSMHTYVKGIVVAYMVGYRS